MKILVVAKQVEVTDDLRELFEKKLKKFDKFFGDQTEAKLDQTTAQADLLREELTAAKGEIERLKARSLWQRIRNK